MMRPHRPVRASSSTHSTAVILLRKGPAFRNLVTGSVLLSLRSALPLLLAFLPQDSVQLSRLLSTQHLACFQGPGCPHTGSPSFPCLSCSSLPYFSLSLVTLLSPGKRRPQTRPASWGKESLSARWQVQRRERILDLEKTTYSQGSRIEIQVGNRIFSLFINRCIKTILVLLIQFNYCVNELEMGRGDRSYHVKP